MAAERWWINGWELTEGSTRDVEFRNGLNTVPAPQGVNGIVPNRAGEVWARKTHGAGIFTLNVWLGDGSGQDVLDVWENLQRAAIQMHTQVRYVRQLPDGSQRECYGEVLSALEPTHMGSRGMRCGLEVRNPSAYWMSTTQYTETSAIGATLPKTLALDDFAPSTAPMALLSYDIHGPITNATVVDVTDGQDRDYFTYSGSLPNGAVLTVNSWTWLLSATGAVADPGRLNVYGPRMLTVQAGAPGVTPTVQLRGTGGGAATRLVVRGARSFL